jgi:Na+/H+ antiporter NhaD/arsenite permease-like protein
MALAGLAGLLFFPCAALAAAPETLPTVLGIRIEFILFALTLLGVAVFHHHTLPVGLSGLAVITLYKFAFTGFGGEPGLAGFVHHLGNEWVVLTNLFCLLLGFALLSNYFEESQVPAVLPRFLPDDWKGGFVLLVLVFILSSFLDNIAAALIGATMARVVFKGRIHIGFLAAIVAASNAGGSGSVVGDTTTTLMWIDGVSPMDVLHAYVAAGVALVVCAIPAAIQQQRFSPIVAEPPAGIRVDWIRVAIVAFILAAAIVVNVTINVKFNAVSDAFPFIGVAVWVAILLSCLVRRPQWSLLPAATKGSIFLLSLVMCASLMPVETLPAASWMSAFVLGFVSAVFDNIPLTKLALEQGGFDWGFIAYAVGFGGSMIWFGSSAGVAVSNTFPEAKSVGSWIRHGWHVSVAYVIGFAVLYLTLGWHPHAPHKVRAESNHPSSSSIQTVQPGDPAP